MCKTASHFSQAVLASHYPQTIIIDQTCPIQRLISLISFSTSLGPPQMMICLSWQTWKPSPMFALSKLGQPQTWSKDTPHPRMKPWTSWRKCWISTHSSGQASKSASIIHILSALDRPNSSRSQIEKWLSRLTKFNSISMATTMMTTRYSGSASWRRLKSSRWWENAGKHICRNK